MSKKTLEDSASQQERTAKTPDLIEFTTADKYVIQVCRVCGEELSKENWYPSYQKQNNHRRDNCICKRCENERYGHRSFKEDKECSLFLGVHIAERVLSHVFKDVEKMPMHNPGYDFTCNQGKWIDVKSSCMRDGKNWMFTINKNTIADYFLCIAFNNRKDLNPLHAWLIPGSKVNHHKGIGISMSTLSKWDSYRIDISKISKCCDEMRCKTPTTKEVKNTDHKKTPYPPTTKSASGEPKEVQKDVNTDHKKTPYPPTTKSASEDLKEVQKEVKNTDHKKTPYPPTTKSASGEPKEVQKEVKKDVNTDHKKTPPTHLTSTSSPKRSTNNTRTENLNLSIITLLKSGLRPSKICSKLGIMKSALQYHLNILKDQGVIYKVGYGVWEVINEPEKAKTRSTKTPYVAKEHVVDEVQKNQHQIMEDSVRAHAFTFTLKVPPDLRNWTNEKRVEYLDKKGIQYKSLGIIGGGQRLIIEGRKTWLTNKSVVIYDTGSYFAEKAIEAKSEAVQSFISIVKKLERLLHVELTVGSDYKFKVSRQHYALMKNALAKQYNSEGQILEVRSESDNSLWFLIDNSFNLNEAETVHSDTAMPDNQKMQNFFNGVKNTGITPEFILEAMNGIQGNQEVFAENTESHIEAIRDLSKGTNNFTDAGKEFSGVAKEMLKLLKEMSRRNNQGSAFEIITL